MGTIYPKRGSKDEKNCANFQIFFSISFGFRTILADLLCSLCILTCFYLQIKSIYDLIARVQTGQNSSCVCIQFIIQFGTGR